MYKVLVICKNFVGIEMVLRGYGTNHNSITINDKTATNNNTLHNIRDIGYKKGGLLWHRDPRLQMAFETDEVKALLLMNSIEPLDVYGWNGEYTDQIRINRFYI